MLKEHAVKEIFKNQFLFTIITSGYWKYNQPSFKKKKCGERSKFWFWSCYLFTFILRDSSCEFVYFSLICWICIVVYKTILFFFFSFFLKMLTWTDFISLNHSQKSDWWASVFSESCRAGAFPCFLIVLLIWKRDYFECFKIHVDCREVWWHSHWIFFVLWFFSLCVYLQARSETPPKRDRS